MIDADPLSHTVIRIAVTPGRAQASICLLLEGKDSRRREIILQRRGEIDSTELQGFGWKLSRLFGSPSRLLLGAPNVLEVRISPRRMVISVNHVEVGAADLDDGWSVRRYGVGFRDGDTESVVRTVLVSDGAPRPLKDGQRVDQVPQLAQPSTCRSADQNDAAKAPVLVHNSIGSNQGLLFDGSDTLYTDAPLDGTSLTIFAVVKRGHISGRHHHRPQRIDRRASAPDRRRRLSRRPRRRPRRNRSDTPWSSRRLRMHHRVQSGLGRQFRVVRQRPTRWPARSHRSGFPSGSR